MESIVDTSLRLATVGDIDALVALRAAFLSEFFGADPQGIALLTALGDYFTLAVPEGRFIAYLAEEGGRIVGIGGMVYHIHPPSVINLGGKEAYLMNMYTLPDYRGRGIATRILAKLVAHAKEAGCGRVTLHSAQKARPIYTRAGFEAVTSEMRLVFPQAES